MVTHDYIGRGPYDWLIVAVLVAILVALFVLGARSRGPE